jgi:hypothetical protein
MAGRTIRELNRVHRVFAEMKLGERISALWNQRQSGGALTPNTDTTKFDVAAGLYTVDGVVVNKASATTAQTLASGANTTASQYRKAVVGINQSGTFAVTYGPTAASQNAALKPPVPSGQTEVGYFEIPISFTAGTTPITSGMCKQAAPPAAALGPLP